MNREILKLRLGRGTRPVFASADLLSRGSTFSWALISLFPFRNCLLIIEPRLRSVTWP